VTNSGKVKYLVQLNSDCESEISETEAFNYIILIEQPKIPSRLINFILSSRLAHYEILVASVVLVRQAAAIGHVTECLIYRKAAYIKPKCPADQNHTVLLGRFKFMNLASDLQCASVTSSAGIHSKKRGAESFVAVKSSSDEASEADGS
jgi:hypothetical protein